MNLLPDKQLHIEDSLIGKSARVLALLDHSVSINDLWERCREHEFVRSFEHFIHALDLLFLLGAVEYRNGLVERQRR